MNLTKLSHWHSFMYDSVQEEYISNYLKENVAVNEQEKFAADLEYDLNTLASYNIAGMGITQKQLEEWKIRLQV